MRVCIVIVIKLGCPSGSEREEGKEGPSKAIKITTVVVVVQKNRKDALLHAADLV